MDNKIQISEIEKACHLAGGQASLARLIGVAPPTVNQWITGVRPIPPRFAVLLEIEFSGQIFRNRLRPDDWKQIWPELIGKKSAVKS